MSKVIKLQKLVLHNFMKVKDETIDFSDVTDIFGDNGTGKTTVFTAFTWLLFDKDSEDKSKFDVQPLDANNNVIHMLDTSVEGVLLIDGKPITLKKLLKEKWVKKRGETESELKGTETSYYIDDVPLKQGEYKARIADITGGENIFKLITNPMYFPTVLTWQERRKILFELNGGELTDEQVINYNPVLKPLQTLLEGKGIDALKDMLKARLKKLKKDKEDIPARVDELNRSIQEFDFDALDINRRGIVAGINNIDDKLANIKTGNNLEDKKKLYQMQAKLMEMEQKAKEESRKPLDKLQSGLQQVSMDKFSAENKLTFSRTMIEESQKEIERLKALNDTLAKQWYSTNAKTLTFDEDAFICPTCKRPFDEADIESKKEEMQQNFNIQKADNLKSINEAGKANKKKIEELQKKISDTNIEQLETNLKDLEAKAQDLQTQIDNFEPEINYFDIPGYKTIWDEANNLKAELSKPTPVFEQEGALKQKKAELERELAEANSQLAYKDANEKAKTRIAELKAEEKKLAQQIADVEKEQALCEQFTKTKVELLEGSINSKFKYVTFRLFKQQVNGGIEDDCEPLVNGVPFSTNLNDGARINAGLDIINALCEFYQVQAPIFIDNRESLSQAIKTSSQVINLIKPADYDHLDSELQEILIKKYGSAEKAKACCNGRNKTLRVETEAE